MRFPELGWKTRPSCCCTKNWSRSYKLVFRGRSWVFTSLNVNNPGIHTAREQRGGRNSPVLFGGRQMFWFSLGLELWFNSQIISCRGGTSCKSHLQRNLWDFWWRLRMVAWKSQDCYINTGSNMRILAMKFCKAQKLNPQPLLGRNHCARRYRSGATKRDCGQTGQLKLLLLTQTNHTSFPRCWQSTHSLIFQTLPCKSPSNKTRLSR